LFGIGMLTLAGLLAFRPKWFCRIGEVFHKPLKVFALINPKSGGCLGESVAEILGKEGIKTWNLPDFSQDKSLYAELARELSRTKAHVIICGGDGTTSWGLSVLDKAQKVKPFDYILGLMPLGSGNDLSRCLGWGTSYPGDDVLKIHADETLIAEKHSLLDRWDVCFEDQLGEVTGHREMVNYFNLGIEADISYKFDEARKQHPDSFNGTLKNWWKYARLSLEAMVTSHPNLNDNVIVTADGKLMKLVPGTKSVVVSNIQSMAQGLFYWGEKQSDPAKKFTDPQLGDGKFELMCGHSMHHLSMTSIGFSHYNRLAQPKEVTLELRDSMPLQLDGEAWMQSPGRIIFTHKGQVRCAVGPGHETRGLTVTKSIW